MSDRNVVKFPKCYQDHAIYLNLLSPRYSLVLSLENEYHNSPTSLCCGRVTVSLIGSPAPRVPHVKGVCEQHSHFIFSTYGKSQFIANTGEERGGKKRK